MLVKNVGGNDMYTVVLLGALGIHSYEDIRKQEITVSITLLFGVIGVFLHVIYGKESIYFMMAGALTGLLLCGISVMSGGKIGMGDGVVTTLTGFYLGAQKNIELMIVSTIFAGLYGLFGMWRFQYNTKTRIPMIPFFLLGYLTLLAFEGICK